MGGMRLEKRNETLIPIFSREREKGHVGASLLHPLPLAGEGRVRVFFFHG